jgi:hypothetical protein
MSYVVYVNAPTNKAIVHNTSCGKYKSRKRDKTPHGYWTEPFSDLESACNYANSTGKKNVDTCSFCCKYNEIKCC